MEGPTCAVCQRNAKYCRYCRYCRVTSLPLHSPSWRPRSRPRWRRSRRATRARTAARLSVWTASSDSRRSCGKTSATSPSSGAPRCASLAQKHGQLGFCARLTAACKPRPRAAVCATGRGCIRHLRARRRSAELSVSSNVCGKRLTRLRCAETRLVTRAPRSWTSPARCSSRTRPTSRRCTRTTSGAAGHATAATARPELSARAPIRLCAAGCGACAPVCSARRPRARRVRRSPAAAPRLDAPVPRRGAHATACAGDPAITTRSATGPMERSRLALPTARRRR